MNLQYLIVLITYPTFSYLNISFSPYILKKLYVTLVTIYVRPRHPIPHQFFQYISDNFWSYVIVADVNIHSHPNRERGASLPTLQTTSQASCTNLQNLHVPSPTQLLTVILSPDFVNRSAIDILHFVGSHYFPVKLTLHRYLPKQPAEPSTCTSTRSDYANWNQYWEFITDQLENTQAPTNEEELYQALRT